MTAESSSEARVRNVIARTFRLTANEAAGDLRMSHPPAWDSLGHMELVVALEAEFGVRFPGYVISQLDSIESIVDELDKSLAK
jgi:acyl carrier protein